MTVLFIDATLAAAFFRATREYRGESARHFNFRSTHSTDLYLAPKGSGAYLTPPAN